MKSEVIEQIQDKNNENLAGTAPTSSERIKRLFSMKGTLARKPFLKVSGLAHLSKMVCVYPFALQAELILKNQASLIDPFQFKVSLVILFLGLVVFEGIGLGALAKRMTDAGVNKNWAYSYLLLGAFAQIPFAFMKSKEKVDSTPQVQLEAKEAN